MASEPHRSVRHPSAQRAARFALLSMSLLVSAGLAEVALRVAAPATLFLDGDTDAYWAALIQHSGGRMEYARNVEYDRLLGWRMKPQLRREGVSHDERGVRGPHPVRFDRRRGVPRLVALGDSFTYGLGVRDEETYAARLREELPGWETVNLGVNGYGVGQQVLMWEQHGLKYRPDLVVLGLYVHDFHRSDMRFMSYPKPRFQVRDSRLVLEGVPVPRLEDVLQAPPPAPSGLRLVDGLRYVGGALAKKLGRPERLVRMSERSELNHYLLRRLDDSVRASGARLLVAIIPHRDYDDYTSGPQVVRSLLGACDELDIPCLDLGPTLKAAEREGARMYSPDNGHWTPEGHSVAARAIAELLRDQN